MASTTSTLLVSSMTCGVMPSREAVLATYDAWRALDLKVVMEPTDLPFGFSFVVEDPDGHLWEVAWNPEMNPPE